MMDALPDEVVVHIVSYLTPRDVGGLMQTSRHLLEICKSDLIWHRLCVQDKGVTWRLPGQTWFDLYRTDTHGVCPHLACLDMRPKDLQQYHEFVQEVDASPSMRCHGAGCAVQLPDLWLCLTPGCGYIGCGRYQNGHALTHSESTGHPLAFKARALMLWCYKCPKWIGALGSPELEQHRFNELIGLMDERRTRTEEFWTAHQQRLEGRRVGMTRLLEPEELFLVHPRVFQIWNDFVLGNTIELPVLPIQQQQQLRKNIVNGMRVMYPNYLIMRKSLWTHLQEHYDAGPDISLNWALQTTRSRRMQRELLGIRAQYWREVQDAQASDNDVGDDVDMMDDV